MLINDSKIKAAKTTGKNYKMTDGKGLHLLIKANGSKLWQFRYNVNGRENVYSIGCYPEYSLLEAREERFRLRKLVKAGIDPNLKKKEAKIEASVRTENSFASVALEWHKKQGTRWTAEHAKKIRGWLDNDIAPFIGQIPIAELKPLDILHIARRVESRGANYAARRILSICSRVLRYGIATNKCLYDVTIGINQALVPMKSKNYNCIGIQEFPELVRKIETANCKTLTRHALKFMILTFVRTTELRAAKWIEVDFRNQEWRIPAERMKMGEQHIVPLSTQALKILADIHKLGYHSDYIFPSETNMRKFMSENTMLYALYDMGYHHRMTVHGFRQLASTILNEKGFAPDAIERQLAHAERNNVRRAYNHAQYLPVRREMMQWWADYISNLAHEW